MNNNKGAVSIQAIFMMLVLVTLGAFAITSARANYTFSMKAYEWNKMFYAMEDKAERFVRDVDAALAGAKGADTESYLDSAYDELAGLTFIYPEAGFSFDDSGSLYAEMNFVSQDNEDANLSVVLKINGEMNADSRYSVVKWLEWQHTEDFDDGMSLWDGTFDF